MVPFKKKNGKLTSMETTFSCWNTMLGSGIVTLPWTFYHSGVVLGSIISFLSFAASLRSCIIILRLTGPKDDFYDTMRKYWGMPGYYVSMGGTLTVIMTACTAYYLIMA
jgi:amino acid permease